MDRRVLLVGFLGIVVLLAGCTQPNSLLPNPPESSNGDDGESDDGPSTSQTRGLIVDLSTQADTYFSDDTVQFTASAENHGDFEATGIEMQMYGASWVATDERQDVSDLEAYDRRNDFVRGEESVVFEREVVTELDTGATDEYDAGVLTYYDYGAQTRSKFTVMDSETYQEEGAEGSAMSNDRSVAPVHITFTGETPYAYTGSSSAYIPLEVENVGDGSVQDSEVTVDVRIEGEGTVESCSDTIEIDSDSTLRCELSTDRIDLGATPQKTFTFIAEANYTYIDDTSMSITVEGR